MTEEAANIPKPCIEKTAAMNAPRVILLANARPPIPNPNKNLNNLRLTRTQPFVVHTENPHPKEPNTMIISAIPYTVRNIYAKYILI
jgi:hypothetical protein